MHRKQAKFQLSTQEHIHMDVFSGTNYLFQALIIWFNQQPKKKKTQNIFT